MSKLLGAGLLLACTLPCLSAPALAMGGDRLYTVSPYDNNLRVVDPLTAKTLSAVAITAPGTVVIGANGLAVHPVTSELWAVLQLQGGGARSLAKLNPTTGVATVIGNTGDKFAGLAFDRIGTLHGVTGDGAATAETLFTLSLTTGQATLLLNLGNGTEGETIAFHPTTGLLFHASGLGTQNATEILETVDLQRKVTASVPLSGDDYEEAVSLTWWIGDNFLLSDFFNDLYVVSATGLVSRIGTLDHPVKGMAFLQRSGPHFDLYGNGFPANGGHVPVLAGSGTPTPNGTFATGIVNGPGPGLGVLVMGLGQNTLQVSPICVLQNLPILSFVTPVVLAGTGNGKGRMSVAFQVPPGTQPGDLFFQVVLFEGLTPFVTNPLQIHIQ